MADRCEIRFDVTRDDWIAANKALLRISPYWDAAARKYRKAATRQVLAISPFIVVGAAVLIGRASATRGMYVEGVLVGAAFAGLMLWGLPRIDRVSKTKNDRLVAIERMDLGRYVGPGTLSMDESGVHICTPSREFRLSWTAVVAHDIGEYILFQHSGSDGTFVPRRAFASDQEAAAFVSKAREWWQAGQLSPADRLRAYLSGRDARCPKCCYNVRGLAGDTCPECGETLTVERLIQS